MYTKLFERLVTKFSIKVTDLIKYLEISKATIYNYRNLEKFSDIPKDKQLKIFYLFGKESEQELELVLDEADPDILAGIQESLRRQVDRFEHFYEMKENFSEEMHLLRLDYDKILHLQRECSCAVK